MTENKNKLLWAESHGGMKREGMTADGRWRVTLSMTLENAIRGFPGISVLVWSVRDDVTDTTFDVGGGFDAAKAAAQEFVDAQEAKLDVRPLPEDGDVVGSSALVTEQAPPVANAHPAVWPLVLDDMKARDGEGRRKYGVPLQPHNGRDTLVDLYQELLDAAVYTRTLIYERDGK